MKIKILVCTFFSVFLVFAASAESLPSPNHEIMFGYYHVDSQYGDFKDEVKDYTNTQIILEESWIRPPNVTNLDIQKLNDALNESIDLGHKTVYMPARNTSDWEQSVNLAKPYWQHIEFIYLADEPSWDKATTERNINNFKGLVTRAGLNQKRIAINYTPQQLENGTGHQASNLDIVGFEAYIDPSLQDSANLVQTLNTQIDASKQKIGNKKTFIVIQAYDRNGSWNNLNSLVAIQTPPYIKAHNNRDVIGLFAFTYAQPGGTRDNSILKESHRTIWEALSGQSTTNTSTPTNATPGWFGDLAFSTRENVWLVVSQSNSRIVGRFTDDQGKPKSGVFTISPESQNGGVGSPSVAYSQDANKFLVVWYNFSNGNSNDYGRFVSADGSMSAPFEFNSNNPILSAGADKLSSLKYDSRNKKFVLVWGFGNSALLSTIDLNGTRGPLVNVNDSENRNSFSPKVAVNEDQNEYCVIYDLRNVEKWGVARIDASTLRVTQKYTVDTFAWRTDIAYNPNTKKYLATYTNRNRDTIGRLMSSCNPNNTDNSADFTILENSGSGYVAANLQNGTFGVIGQNQNDFGNNFAVVDSSGEQLSSGTLLVSSRNGQFVPNISANANNGTYAAITDRDYEETVILTGIGRDSLERTIPRNIPPFTTSTQPTVPTQGLLGFGQLIAVIFTWSLNVLGIVVFVMIFYAGFKWFTAAGNTARVNEARAQITNAITGAIILLAAYIILYTINPDLVGGTLNLPGIR